MLPPLINSASDIITSHQAVRDGFLSQALAKTAKAEPYIGQAKRLREFLKQTDSIETAVRLPSIRVDLLAAAGFSDKAQSHLTDEELTASLQRVVGQIAEGYPDEWRQELLYRFLLTRGDSLGGSMRNYTGALAGRQLAEALLAALNEQAVTYSVRHASKNPEKIQAVAWPNRALLFDRKCPFVGNNIDAILLDTSSGHAETQCFIDQACYLACGELKGGIDPAGADEHWKTADTALRRIRDAFTENRPELFFVGAAIETTMANQIFAQLEDGRLAYAANPTVPEQVADLAIWLCGL